MVHELLNIQNGRVDLNLVPDIRPELKVGLVFRLTKLYCFSAADA